MRFLTIAGANVTQDEWLCPTFDMLLDEQDGYRVCPRCTRDMRQGARKRRARRRQRR